MSARAHRTWWLAGALLACLSLDWILRRVLANADVFLAIRSRSPIWVLVGALALLLERAWCWFVLPGWLLYRVLDLSLARRRFPFVR